LGSFDCVAARFAGDNSAQDDRLDREAEKVTPQHDNSQQAESYEIVDASERA